jgi:hypothetical protein
MGRFLLKQDGNFTVQKRDASTLMISQGTTLELLVAQPANVLS